MAVEPNGQGPDEEMVAARDRAGRAVRDIGHALIGHDVPIELIDEVTGTLNGLRDRLNSGAARQRQSATYATWHGAPADGDVITSFADRPISGTASPWGCDIVTRREGDEAVARFTLRSAHEGAPGRSHGGIVAALFDDVMGFVIQIHQVAAFTGELSVRYERGVPLHRELVMRARLGSHHGRKVHITADLWDGDERVATAKATFISIPEGHYSSTAPE